MATIPVIPAFAATTGVTSAQLTELAAAVSFALNPPRVLVYKNQTTTRTSNTAPVGISYDAALVNTDSMWSTSQPNRLYCNTPGMYDIEFMAHYQTFPSASGCTQWGLGLNSGGVWPSTNSVNWLAEQVLVNQTTYRQGAEIRLQYFLNVGDYIESFTTQNCGSTMTLFPDGDIENGHFSAIWRSAT